MAPAFDTVASSFERHRLLPSGVPEAIRSAIFAAAAHVPSPARVLDVGAGTGRIGRAFIAANDSYIGVDTSLAMLREFQASSGFGFLVQADGCQLPFHNGAFDVVLFMHVLSGIHDWQVLLNEAQRVLRSGGIMAVGHTRSPESGIDGQLKRRLRSILQEMGVHWQPQESRREALVWLESQSTRHVHSQAASWKVSTSAKEFLLRHRSGARFAALPGTVQEQALQKLNAWAEKTLGPLDTEFDEERNFELDIFEF
ncbi:MAG TPA: class I SAM-dependent methyltransferase [Candidatus Angelobacter sp.]|nr:class I SAM-dependent methyltransferase [Candidatus Angelobacter sp.]